MQNESKTSSPVIVIMVALVVAVTISTLVVYF